MKSNYLLIALAPTAAVMGLVSAGAVQAIEATTSGHVNRAIMFADDGENSETFFVDNETSNTRFRFVGKEAINDDVTAGVKFEVEWVSNNSSDVTMDNRDPGTELNERHMDAFVEGGFGKVSLGQGDGAANGGIEIDLSGTSIINYSGVDNLGTSLTFQDGGVAGPTIGATINNLDFESRYDRVRYDTPALGITTLSIATGTSGDGDAVDLAARFTSNLGAGDKIAAAIGFSTKDTGGAAGDQETTGGSISWLSAGGFNLTGALSMRENDDGLDASFSYLKGGYKTGKHAVSIDYALGEDQAADGDESDMIGIGYVFKPITWAEFYAGAKVHSLDRSGANFDDISIVTGGTRLKFL